MDTLMRDLQFAVRRLRRAPGLTVVALLVLALGTGASLALVSVEDTLVLRELPVSHPEELVALTAEDAKDPSDTNALSLAAIRMLEGQQHVFAAVGGDGGSQLTAVAGGVPEYVNADGVTGGYFGVLGVRPAIGRLITEEDVASSARVVVLSYAYWQRRFGGDGDVIGKVIRLVEDSDLPYVPFTVVGVTQPGFSGLYAGLPTEVTIPAETYRQIVHSGTLDQPLFRRAIGRLSSGVTPTKAREAVQALWPAMLRTSVPATMAPQDRDDILRSRLDVESAATGFSLFKTWYSRPLSLLVLSSAWLLLIACANLASLLLARSMARQEELRVRLALGASRRRLLQDVLTEALLLSAAGTALGLPLAFGGARWLLAMLLEVNPLSSYYQFDLTLDRRVVFAIAASAIGTGLAFGLGPAWWASRRESTMTIGAARSTGRATSPWSTGLLVAQVSLAAVLLVGAGLLAMNWRLLRSTQPGFQMEGLSVVELDPQPGGSANLDVAAYCRALVDHVAAVPGVSGAALVFREPFLGFHEFYEREPISSSSADPGQAVEATLVAVSPGFFQTMGVSVTHGRDFAWTDDARRGPVAILSDGLAKRVFPGAAAVGRQIRVDTEPRRQHVEVLGVTSDAILTDFHARNPLVLFVALLQEPPLLFAGESPTIVTRGTAPQPTLEGQIRRTVEALGHDSVVGQRTLAERADQSLVRERIFAVGGTYFGGLAVALVAIGLGGVLAASVARRTREIGLRSALGGSPSALKSMILRQALGVGLLGLALGLPCAWLTTPWLQSTLTTVGPHNPLVFAGAALVTLLVTVVAAWVPARRAAAIAPMDALRAE
jgi:predicted permease